MNIPDLISMDHEDDSSLSPTPNDFILSTYRENSSVTMNQEERTGDFRIQFSIRREPVADLFDQDDYEEYQQYSAERPMYAPYSDRMFLLIKFNQQKKILQSEFQRKLISSIELRQMSEDIQLRKNHFKLTYHWLQKSREENEQTKQRNIQTRANIDKLRSRNQKLQLNITRTTKFVKSSRIRSQEKIKFLTNEERNLQRIRREHLKELVTYVFPFQRVAAAENNLVARLRDAQEKFVDGLDNEQAEDDLPLTPDDRYQLVNSSLPNRGDYHIENVVTIYNGAIFRDNADGAINDFDTLHLSPYYDSYEILSGLSHACQLINSVAFYLHIKLPFHLHQCEFTQENLKIDDLRADIAKLNANILSACLSQGIPIALENVSYTMENLLKLLHLEEYPSRAKSVDYPERYTDILEREVIDVSRALGTSYWFDNDDRIEIASTFNDYEYELVPEHEYIPDDIVPTNEHNNSSQTAFDSQPPPIMSSSLGYLKTKGSDLINSLFGSLK